jgi:hypothetical protein
MIRYRLKCGDGHEFEAWFASSSAYETQESEGRLACPHCARTDIERAIMAPKIAAGRTQAATPEIAAGNAAPNAALHADSTDARRLQALMREMRTLRDKMLEKSEYVGPRFAEEARRIHHEETPDRAIHGEATTDEVKELADEGIDIMPIPRLPDDMN